MKNNLTNIKSDNINKIDWKLLQNEMKNKFGSEIYDSWLKKIDLVDEFKNYDGRMSDEYPYIKLIK